MNASVHLCKAPGCPQQAKPGQLMCRSHWFALPKPLRDAIYATVHDTNRRAYVANVREAQRLLAPGGDVSVPAASGRVYPALTLWQPWATLAALRLKPLEFRSWAAPERLWDQRIAIHASARKPSVTEMRGLLAKLHSARWQETGLVRDGAIELLERALRGLADLPVASVVAIATLGRPIRNEELFARLGTDASDGFGNGSINDSDRNQHSNWGWPLSDIEALDPIVPAAGARGFWSWTGPAE